MVSKNWLWVVIAGLVIVTVHQIMMLPGGGSAESQPLEAEQALEPDGRAMHAASLGDLPGMLEQKRQPVIESAEAQEQEQTSAATTQGSKPGPEEPEPDTAESAETVEVARVEDMPLPALDQPEIEAIPQSPAVDALVGFSNKGLVRGVVYSGEDGSALIGETIVQTGGTVDGVKVLRIHAGGVDFEKDGRRWTQKVSEAPDPQWR